MKRIPGSINAFVRQHCNQATVVLDPCGQILSLNGAAEKFFGYRRSELTGEQIELIIPHWQIIRENQTQVLVKLKNGNDVLSDVKLHHQKSGNGVFTIVFIYDTGAEAGNVNDIPKYEQMKHELTAMRNDLNDLIKVLSHDLQEPVRKTLLFADIIMRESGNERVQQKCQERIVDLNLQLRKKLNSLSFYLNVSLQPKKVETLDLNNVLESVVSNLQYEVSSTGMRVSASRLPIICGDPVHLTYVFENIISNAIKFRSNDRLPEIKIRFKEVSSGKTEKNIKIIFQDNGKGFDKKQKNQIFGLFCRANTTDDSGNAAVGLALCRKLMRLHGGDVSAFGKPGVGSIFSITLPAI